MQTGRPPRSSYKDSFGRLDFHRETTPFARQEPYEDIRALFTRFVFFRDLLPLGGLAYAITVIIGQRHTKPFLYRNC